MTNPDVTGCSTLPSALQVAAWAHMETARRELCSSEALKRDSATRTHRNHTEVPPRYYRGRGAFESMGAGLTMAPGDIAFKSNFATLDPASGVVTARRADRRFKTLGPRLCADLDGGSTSRPIPSLLPHKRQAGGLLADTRDLGRQAACSSFDQRLQHACVKCWPPSV